MRGHAMNSPDLLDWQERYPHQPGFKKPGTSEAAAKEMAGRAPRLRDRIIDCLRRYGPMTPDEAADRLGVSILSARPRFSELARMGIIVPTGERRKCGERTRADVMRLVESAQ
jgi:hypothetical protein